MITQGNAALPHFRSCRTKSTWSPNREQASLLIESLLEKPNELSRLSYYPGGCFHKDAAVAGAKDVEVAVSLAGTGEKVSSSLLEIPRGMMDESFGSSIGSEHYLPKLLSPKTANAASPEKSPTKPKSELPHQHNKTISRLLDSVSPDLKAQLEKATPVVPQHNDVVVGRTAGNGWHRGRPPRSRGLSSSFGKPRTTPEGMGVTGTQWIHAGAPGEITRPRTAAALQSPQIEVSQVNGFQRRTSTGTDLDTLVESTPQLLRPKYLGKPGSTPKPDPKVVDVKIPTPKFRAATVQIPPQDGEMSADRRRASTMICFAPIPPVTELSIRITPKAGERLRETDVSRGESEIRPSEASYKGSVDRVTPEELLPPKITTSKCVSVGPSKQSTPTPELMQVTYDDHTGPLAPITQSELNASLAITVLQPRLSQYPSKRRSSSQGYQPFHSSYRFPGATPVFLSEKLPSLQSKRPRSGASHGQVIKGRARLEGGLSKGREVRCFRITT